MSFSTLTLTLNYSGQPNVSSTLLTGDYPSAVAAAQAIVKNSGIWVNTSVGAANTQFIPSSAVLFITIS